MSPKPQLSNPTTPCRLSGGGMGCNPVSKPVLLPPVHRLMLTSPTVSQGVGFHLPCMGSSVCCSMSRWPWNRYLITSSSLSPVHVSSVEKPDGCDLEQLWTEIYWNLLSTSTSLPSILSSPFLPLKPQIFLLHLLSPLEPRVSDTHQPFCWGACKGPQPDRAAVAESWQCSRLYWGMK